MGLPQTLWLLDGGAENSPFEWEHPNGPGRMRVGASRLGVALPLPAGQYVCRRCGIQHGCNISRERPEMCADCKYVLAYREPEERPRRSFPTHLSDEECLAARKAVRHGDRSPEVEAAAREYWRRAGVKKRTESREAS